MHRLKNYLHIVAWQLGLAYIALWAITFLALDYGPGLFSESCRRDAARLMFYWVCDPSSPLSFVASIANTALTATIWAPVSVAASTFRPDAIASAAPLLLLHVIGLPMALLVCIRLMAGIFQAPRWLASRRAEEASELPPLRAPAPSAPPFLHVKSRGTFGLRSQKP